MAAFVIISGVASIIGVGLTGYTLYRVQKVDAAVEQARRETRKAVMRQHSASEFARVWEQFDAARRAATANDHERFRQLADTLHRTLARLSGSFHPLLESKDQDTLRVVLDQAGEVANLIAGDIAVRDKANFACTFMMSKLEEIAGRLQYT
jgi:hypothetical protein